MHDIRLIREAPAAFDAALARRGVAPVSATLLAIDESRRAKITAAEQAQAERNAASREVGQAKARGDNTEFERLRALMAAKKDEIAALEAEAAAEDKRLNDLLLTIPNLPLDTVPGGASEADNVEINRWGSPRTFTFKPKEHFDIALFNDTVPTHSGMSGILGAKLSGARFTVMYGNIARLHRAIAQFMLDTHVTENGYKEVWTPVLVKESALIGTGQLPKFEDDLFVTQRRRGQTDIESIVNEWLEDLEGGIPAQTSPQRRAAIASSFFDRWHEEQEKYAGLWLIPTAEVTLTNIVADAIVDESILPLRYTAHTQCFRAEAGSAGKDTRGMLRQHQFEKVEMVSLIRPEDSDAELRRMTRCAEDILERLGLPYRTVVLCTGDMGFGARRTHDLEVWLPGQNAYREISSCSTCGDFQARRMNARFRREGSKKPEFIHTLNGSGLAVGRTLIAVMENGQQADGAIEIPPPLRAYMRGAARINPDGTLG